MRILHITDDYGFTGGIQSYLRHLGDMLKKQGHSVEIYSPAANGGGLSSYFSRWISVKNYSAVKEIVSRFRPHVLHGHSVSMRISPLPFLAAEGIPVIMTVHDFNYVCPRKWMIDPDENPCTEGFGFRCLVSNCFCSKPGWQYLPYHNLRWLKMALHRVMLKKYVQTFICPSEVLCHWMEKNLDVHNTVFIPNFIESTFSTRPEIQNYNQILFVGRLSAEKGVDCLLRAMPLILSSCPDVFLTIVGDGPDRENLERLSQSLNIKSHVRFTGMVNNRGLTDYYEKATICVLPSLWMENCPVAGLEALAFGRPLVGSNIGGIPGLIQEGKTGFICQRNDPNDLAEKIVILMKDRDLVDAFRTNSLSFFEECFSEEQHCEKILSLYSSLVPS